MFTGKKNKIRLDERPYNRTDTQMEKAALAEEVMIPIRLDIDLDSFKIKDAFMWNMNGRPNPHLMLV